MTDRELIELAAKAAGINLEWDGQSELWTPMYYEGKTYHGWNPLEDDGDALRLAVKVGMQVTPPSEAYPHAFAMDALQQRHAVREDDVTDPYAATRRAIVRAAAEIGKRNATRAENEALVAKLRQQRAEKG